MSVPGNMNNFVIGGLCNTCQHKNTCTYQKPPKGVYQCDEYEYSKLSPSEDIAGKFDKELRSKVRR